MNEDLYKDYAEQWTERMRAGKNIVHDYVAKPALYKTLGDLKNKKVLCIGCGSGEECAYIKSQGASEVVGTDISPDFIRIAKESFPDIDFKVMDMEKLVLEKGYFDIVVSSLTMHYVQNWKKTLSEIKKVLSDNGRVIISTNHPIRFGAEVKREKEREIFLLGYIRYKDPKLFGDVIGDYLNERKIDDMWFRNKFAVTYYHKPISSIFNEINESGFEIINFSEPKPEEWVKKENESFYNIHTKIPLFMIFELKKKI